MNGVCPVCKATGGKPFFELLQTPVHVGVPYNSAQAARSCPRGDIKLTFCEACGCIWNVAFDAALVDYDGEYDNSLDHSPTFRAFARTLAEALVERYGIRRKRVIDIGCGKGGFLKLVCAAGDNEGVGFDPTFSYDENTEACEDKVRFVRDYYSPKYADIQGDLICCRHVLEHVEAPLEFLTMLRGMIAADADPVLYFEVPNVRTILRDMSGWTIIYEHCLYLGCESLSNAFRLAGFEVLGSSEYYDGQFAGIEAKLKPGARPSSASEASNANGLAAEVAAFGRQFADIRKQWKQRLERIRQTGEKAAIWGGGARTVGWCNVLEVRDQVPYVVDINPNKQGNYLAGTAQKIVAPGFLKSYRPTLVIVMNSVYKDEIASDIRGMGLDVEFAFA